MKKIFFLLLAVLFTSPVWAQNNVFVEYENIVKDPKSSPLYNASRETVLKDIFFYRNAINTQLQKQFLSEFKADENLSYSSAAERDSLGNLMKDIISDLYSQISPNLSGKNIKEDSFNNYINAFTSVYGNDNTYSYLLAWTDFISDNYKKKVNIDLKKIYNFNSSNIEKHVLGKFSTEEEKIKTVQMLAALKAYLDELKKLKTTDQHVRSDECVKIHTKIRSVAEKYGYIPTLAIPNSSSDTSK
ncbi:hypothetical protein Dip510_001987 [Elusimicrobium posterum]|uniref:hypothetical protein n=1 Tax=Elusimicrobium posterum TaxID=3116653 RepID=UPI003C70C8BB